MQLLSHAVLTVSLVASLLWGLIYSHCVRMALFFKIVLFGEGCILLGELFTVAMYVCLGETEVFHLGMLGPVGCFVFLFSASFGQIDGLGDDRNPRMRRFRLIPLIFPTLYIGLYVLDILSPVHLSVKIIHTFLLLLIAATVYYNFKHLIIPDVTYGIFKSMRKYNLLVLCISALFTVRVLFSDYGINMAENTIAVNESIFVVFREVGNETFTNDNPSTARQYTVTVQVSGASGAGTNDDIYICILVIKVNQHIITGQSQLR